MVIFSEKNDSYRLAIFLGEGIFTMGIAKIYIMYWGFLTVIIIA